MGYWIHEAGIKAFLKKYMYVIFAIVILAVVIGSLSSYTAYLSMIGQYNVTAFEECGNNLLDCIESKNLTQTNLQECKNNLDRTISLLEDLSPIQSQLTTCREDLSSLQQQLSDSLAKVSALLSNATECEEKLIACQDSLNNLTACEGNLTVWQNKYNTLVQNAAYKICCFSDLKYYYIKNNMVVCVSEPNETLGTKELSC